MSTSPEVEGIVVLPAAAPEPDASVFAEAPAEPAETPAPAVRPRRERPAWLIPASIGAAGVIVASVLGYFLYTATQQRDELRVQLVSTRTTLASTQAQLSAAQADAAQKKVTADYVALYVADEGKVLTDYESVVNCGGYSECRTSAQQLETDLQAFQSDRKSADVPSQLQDQDASLGDALSAAIAGDQEVISGMDNNDQGKMTQGGDKVDAAMLNLAKAEAAMGIALR